MRLSPALLLIVSTSAQGGHHESAELADRLQQGSRPAADRARDAGRKQNNAYVLRFRDGANDKAILRKPR